MSGICYDFQRTGNCRFGNACRFSHGGGGGGFRPPSAGMCREFQSRGSCRFGNNCKFSHTRGGGGGGRGGRGGGGGGGGRGRGGPVDKWRDKACKELVDEVSQKHGDIKGPQLVRCWTFKGSDWVQTESTAKSTLYYYRVTKSGQREIQKSMPDEIKKIQPDEPTRLHDAWTRVAPPSVYPENMPVIKNIVTNSFPIKGKILKTHIHRYVVTFDPPILPDQTQTRRDALFGIRGANISRLQYHFGYFSFDNINLYSMLADGETCERSVEFPTQLKGDDRKMSVHMDWAETVTLEDESLPLSEREMFLNVFMKDRLISAQFTRINRGYFHRRPREQRDPHLKSEVIEDCEVLKGFECAIHLNDELDEKSPSSAKRAVFKADVLCKLVSQRSVHEMALEIGSRYDPSSAKYRDAITKRFMKKYFVMKYNNLNRRIAGIDFKNNENGTFKLMVDKKERDVSFKDYLSSVYGIRSPKKESFVIQDERGNVFLPQHARLTLNSEDTKDYYDKILERTTPDIRERMDRIESFAHRLSRQSKKDSRRTDTSGSESTSNDESKESGPESRREATKRKRRKLREFALSTRNLKCEAIQLRYPDIEFVSKRSGPIKCGLGPRGGFAWKETGGFLETNALRQWAIVADRSSERDAYSVENSIRQYMSRRGFHEDLIARPDIRLVNLSDERRFTDHVKSGDQLILLVLNERKDPSRLKTLFTKAVSSLDAEKRGSSCIVQCLMPRTCRNTSAVMGALEDCMAKVGNVLYKIDPLLPSGTKMIDPKKTWTIGIELSHVKEKPTSVCMATSTKPFHGTMKYTHLSTMLNPPRKDILSFDGMVNLCVHSLETAWRGSHIKRNEKKLPDAIIVFRSGVSENQLRELYTKEVSGIRRALTIFKAAHSLKKWRPKLEFLVISKGILDRFGQESIDRRTGDSRLESLRSPCVIFDSISSCRMWDFVFWPYHHKKRDGKTKPVRYVVLRDDLKLNTKGGAWDLYQFIYALNYCFVFAIPFPMGCTAKPAPLAYAKHYAEIFGQFITGKDSSIESMKQAENLPGRIQMATTINLDDLKAELERRHKSDGRATPQGGKRARGPPAPVSSNPRRNRRRNR